MTLDTNTFTTTPLLLLSQAFTDPIFIMEHCSYAFLHNNESYIAYIPNKTIPAQARTEGGFGRFGRTALLKKGPQFTL